MKLIPTLPNSKVIIVGNPGVGKTSIISTLNSFEFSESTPSTVAASYVSHTISTEKGDISLNIWDTAGQERYRSLIPMYSRNSSAAVLVCDLTCSTSLQSLDEWINILKENCPSYCQYYVVANKKDLNHIIPISHVSNWAETKKYSFFVTTSKDKNTILPLFQKIAFDLINTPITSENVVISNNINNGEVHVKCC